MRKKKLLAILIIIGCTIFTISVLKRIWFIYQSGNRLAREQQQVTDLEKENSGLKDQLQQADSPTFLEKEARDKLNLARPNEIAVVLPQAQSTESAQASAAILGGNWSRWWHLFFE